MNLISSPVEKHSNLDELHILSYIVLSEGFADMRKCAIIYFICLFMGFSACEKDNEGESDNGGPIPAFSFTELVASADTIRAGYETSKITAIATGHELKFQWSASGGTLAGSGSEVEFFTSFCARGVFTVACKATDKRGDSETRQISIFVK
jgi:hypothetical protein